jgi:hypothetical protein
MHENDENRTIQKPSYMDEIRMIKNKNVDGYVASTLGTNNYNYSNKYQNYTNLPTYTNQGLSSNPHQKSVKILENSNKILL